MRYLASAFRKLSITASNWRDLAIVEECCRFVKKHKARIGGQSSGDFDNLQLAEIEIIDVG